ncbi:alpha-galactosidase A [Daldinia caldariorum]|uniref:alpha-galactosidase A n=1 Tax=Daldinia caldariorum TaxID=326644 RepID=UPI0020080B59|nr:alpha-galactosidase A [Daldinia caldariorum]KAI1466307.1 alpha-galactosidase A [Daldinia caldariorum]
MESVRVLAMDLPTAGRNVYQYRILVRADIKYVTVEAGALDDDLLIDMALNFHRIFRLEDFHLLKWNEARVSRNAVSGALLKQHFASKVPGVEALWHPEMIDFPDIETEKQLSPLVQEYEWKEASVTDYRPLGRRSDVAPKYLGHIHEEGKVNGFPLEKVEGRSAGSDDLEICEVALRELHSLGILHGDCNRHNLIIDYTGKATVVNFEKA